MLASFFLQLRAWLERQFLCVHGSPRAIPANKYIGEKGLLDGAV
jgi:hypothetical protein